MHGSTPTLGAALVAAADQLRDLLPDALWWLYRSAQTVEADPVVAAHPTNGVAWGSASSIPLFGGERRSAAVRCTMLEIWQQGAELLDSLRPRAIEVRIASATFARLDDRERRAWTQLIADRVEDTVIDDTIPPGEVHIVAWEDPGGGD